MGCYQCPHALRLLHDADAPAGFGRRRDPRRPTSRRSNASTSSGSTRPGSASTSPPSGRTFPRPDIFIAAALQRTERIKLGTGVSCLPNHNPFHLAHRIAMLDQLARGRFHVGRRVRRLPRRLRGGRHRPAQRLPAPDFDRRRRCRPGAVDGPAARAATQQHDWRFTVPEPDSRIAKHVYVKPFQQPHPPIAVAGVTEKSETLALAGERGWIPMSINFVTPRVLRSHWQSVVDGAERGRPRRRPRRLADLPRGARRRDRRRAGPPRSPRRRHRRATTATTSCRCSASAAASAD